VVVGILKGISKTETIDSLILERLMSMDNYQAALGLFCNNNVNEELVCTIGFNRKSKKYDKVYFPLYQELHSAYVDKDIKAFLEIFTATRKINIGKLWRTYLFKTNSPRAIKKNPLNCLNHTIFDSVTNEHEFKIAFFKIMHLFKAKATLSDYFDLNRRYIKITDIVLFEDGIVQLDIVPKYFFKSIIDNLYEQAYAKTPELYNDCAINKIAPCLNIDEQAVIKSVNAELGTTATTVAEARNVLEDNRYTRLKHLIDTKFSDEQILTLLDYFESRKDSDITKMVTNNADIPTIFEYVLGILWYKISEYQGRILDYMKLSLDADLLPKTHAAGGEADIVYEYGETECYPSHTLLIEATLADRTNQRRMEMEPVSRHLGQHLLRTQNLNSYCIFATTFLDLNVTSDFRYRKSMPFYDSQDSEKYVMGMKIIPLEISELKKIIINSKTYRELYPIFDQAFNSEQPPHLWYKNCIQDSLNN
ncbi:MAG: AlwI family type II restriction endonuclease, partial [Lentisphaeria bacterium]|nr:AlwI family type II restriction endonuclease [Lentisphaeria bacterium]